MAPPVISKHTAGSTSVSIVSSLDGEGDISKCLSNEKKIRCEHLMENWKFKNNNKMKHTKDKYEHSVPAIDSSCLSSDVHPSWAIAVGLVMCMEMTGKGDQIQKPR